MTDEARRDRWGRYLVIPPFGSQLGYTRGTTIAKALDDGGGLIPWKATLAMTGLMRRPGLRGRFEALMTANPERGPWYGSLQSKDASKKLVEECAEAGGSSDRADQGTALHAIFEQFDLGKEVIPAQESTKADLDAYVAAIEAAGITYDRSLIEAMVVLDEYQVAGTADRLACRVPGFDKMLVGDLKTGDDLRYSWQAISIQLAIYAHADNVYRQGAASDGSQDVRLAMPKLSLEHALVMHAPAGQARTDLYIVDIAAGWEAFKTSMWARQWRARKDLATPYAAPIRNRTAAIVAPSFEAPPFDDTPTTPVVVPAAEPERRPVPLVAKQHAAFTNRARPIEGGVVAADAVTALERRYARLDTLPKAWIAGLATQASQHDVAFGLRETKTVRRFELMRALVNLAPQIEPGEEEFVRALLWPVIGDIAHFPALSLGQLLGSLSVVEAVEFSKAADRFIEGLLVASVDEASDTMRLTA